MLQLSYWAKDHPLKARWLIAILRVIIALLAVRCGLIFYVENVRFSNQYLAVALSIFAVGWFFYPYVLKKDNYLRQKCCDFLMGLGAFLIIACWGNRLPEIIIPHATAAPAFTVLKPIDRHLNFVQGVKQSFGKFIQYRLEKLEARKNRGLWIALIILGALLLLFFLIALACSIACNGMEALAFAVLLIGLVGIVYGCIFLIRRVLGKHRKALTPADGAA